MLALLAWMVLATRSSKVNVVGIKTEQGGEQFSDYKRDEEITRKRNEKRILHFVIEFWNIQNVSGGAVRDWKLRQLRRQQVIICNWF